MRWVLTSRAQARRTNTVAERSWRDGCRRRRRDSAARNCCVRRRCLQRVVRHLVHVTLRLEILISSAFTSAHHRVPIKQKPGAQTRRATMPQDAPSLVEEKGTKLSAPKDRQKVPQNRQKKSRTKHAIEIVRELIIAAAKSRATSPGRRGAGA